MKALMKIANYKYTKFVDRGSDGTEEPMIRYDVHHKGKNIAYSSLKPKSTEGDGPWISGLWVDPKHRGKGHAKKLMNRIEKDYKGQTLRMRARPYKDKSVDTDTLVSIYKKWGFEPYDKKNRLKKKL